MIKFLLSSDILLEALQNQEASSAELIRKCISDENIQPWTLAHTTQVCIEHGIASDKIQELLEGIAQIPVNAKLNELALASPAGFDNGLQASAAKMFKIPFVVSLLSGPEVEDVAFISVAEALGMDFLKGSEKVDFLNLNLALHPMFNRMDGWYMEIIQNTAFAGGNHVAEFEKEFAEFCEVPHAVGVSNGTDALLFALLALGIQPGDEIITVPNTFIATTEAISQAGANPVLLMFCLKPI